MDKGKADGLIDIMIFGVMIVMLGLATETDLIFYIGVLVIAASIIVFTINYAKSGFKIVQGKMSDHLRSENYNIKEEVTSKQRYQYDRELSGSDLDEDIKVALHLFEYSDSFSSYD